ncbi:hypothetical protein ACFL50_03420 [Candidatus Latescibacterota bacterium]
MKKQLSFLPFAIVIMFCGCAMMSNKQSESLIGKWSGSWQNDAEFMMYFKDDKTMEGSIKGSMDFEYSAKYSVDFTADPITMDIFDFDNDQMGDARWLGIIKFIERDKLLMRGNISTQGGRPENFEYEAIELTR